MPFYHYFVIRLKCPDINCHSRLGVQSAEKWV